MASGVKTNDSVVDICGSTGFLRPTEDSNGSSMNFQRSREGFRIKRERLESHQKHPAEHCLFSFPVPVVPKSWTILVEPITKQAAEQPHLIFWKPNMMAEEVEPRPSSSFELPHDDETELCSDHSPHKDRVQPLLHNPMVEGDWCGSHQKRRNSKAKMAFNHRERIFTFVADKRMPSPVDLSAIPIREIDIPTPNSIEAAPLLPEGLSSPKRQPITTTAKRRRVSSSGPKPLTFHQLDFNRDTLKSFDRSVFTVRDGEHHAMIAQSPPSGRPHNRLLMEAAEILLELQSDNDQGSIVPDSSLPPLSIASLGVVN